jgi:Tfp pilus assembly protein PilO
MTDSQRLTYLKIGAASCAGLWLLNLIVISPAIDSWSAQSDRIDALRQKVDRGQQLIDRQDSIREHWAHMVEENLPEEVSAAESVAIQGIDRWSIASGIGISSLSYQWEDHDEGYKTFECRASATGTQAALARFIYEMETDKVPVNLNEFEITTRDDRGALLTMTARFSFVRMNTTGSDTP